jgi:serine/threonine protein kinase
VSKSHSIQVPAGFRDSETPALRAGEVVDSTYQIVSLLRNTETGAVYEARDMLLDRTVALKLAWRDPGAARLLPEARLCSGVGASPAVTVYAIGNHHGAEFVVAERLSGELLSARLGRQRLDDHEMISLWRLIAKAVADCHGAGMAVGDVSGETVLLSGATNPNPRLLLGRFSMSQVPAVGRHGQIFAPEIARGRAGPDDPMAAEAIDLYTLGALELASGQPLFADNDPQVVARCHAERSPPSLLDYRSEVPSDLADLVDWLLVKEPDARPPSVAEVCDELDAILERSATAKLPLRVLVVDHNPTRCRWLSSLARRAHPAAQVITAAEGGEAADKLHREYPDILFIDAELTGTMNALELGMYARSLETANHCKVVVLGEASAPNQAVLERLGASMVPFAPSALLQVIRTACEDKQRAQSKRPRRRSGVQG